mgnify:CR=1 FL=1
MEQENRNQQNAAPQVSLGDQIKVRREKLAQLQAEGMDPFTITRFVSTTTAQEIKDHFDEMEGKPVSIAGRLMSKRGMGKVSFCDLQDKTGRIQLYARKDEMDEAEYNRFKKYDIGDIVGVEGEIFRTQRGEMSVRAKTITLLSKSLLPLPEKFHGLTDKETRYRQRYVDLIVNPEVKRNFIIRSQFIKHLRDYLDNMGYIEVETPVLNTIAGGAAARPFITHHNTLDIDMYMRIATELPLKRLIVGGMDRVYEVGRIFRNEGMDPKHNPEFTTVELYQAYADFHDMMDIAEGVYTTFAQKYLGTYELNWMGETIDLTPGWPRLTMVDAVKQYVGVDFGAITDDAEAVAAAKAVGVELAEAAEKTWGNQVELTIPADFLGDDTTQQVLDEKVAETDGIISATLNEDGSATYVMTAACHEKLMQEMGQNIDTQLTDMAGSSDYPNVISVEASNDYTSFTVTLSTDTVGLQESIMVMAFYLYGGMYNAFNGTPVDDVFVQFVNQSGAVIETANSRDMQ